MPRGDGAIATGPYAPDDGVPSERSRVEALKTLGLPRGARAEEVRAAYLRLARALHPDLHPDDPEKVARFQAVAAAYELLRRYYRHLRPAGRVERDATQYDPLWWRMFGERV